MKFVVITYYTTRIIEADDIGDAVEKSYNNHSGFADILAIVRIPEEE